MKPKFAKLQSFEEISNFLNKNQSTHGSSRVELTIHFKDDKYYYLVKVYPNT